MFRQRAKKPKRTRAPVEDDGSDGNEVSLDELRELREDQKARKRQMLVKGVAATTEPAPTKAKTAETNTLDGQFTAQSQMTTADHYAQIMNTYVEEKLKAKYKLDDGTNAAPALTAEQELYRIPDELKKKMNIPDSASAPEGGIVTWNTGIAEVELPKSVHDQVVEATKEALERQQHNEATLQISSALPTNVSANYKQHKHDYITDLKSQSKEDQRAKGFQHVDKNAPSDDRVMHQFRRELSRQRRK
ncbi:hypothetical protein SDRG_08322, partial [Saprolegnia diclina VS20]